MAGQACSLRNRWSVFIGVHPWLTLPLFAPIALFALKCLSRLALLFLAQ